jgi:transcriptional regulator with XRE-family HTH domain
MGIGNKIRQIRKAAGLRLEDVAARAGLYKTNLSRIENDRLSKPNLATLEKIAQALNCRIGDFFEQTMELDEFLTGGLRDLLNDERSMLLLQVTEDEIEWMKSVRFRPNQKPSRQTYIDLLYTYRKLDDQHDNDGLQMP